MDPGFRWDSESGSCQFFISVSILAQPLRFSALRSVRFLSDRRTRGRPNKARMCGAFYRFRAGGAGGLFPLRSGLGRRLGKLAVHGVGREVGPLGPHTAANSSTVT